MRRLLLVFSAVAVISVASQADAPWHTELWGSGGGYWRLRVPVVVENRSTAEVNGCVLNLRIGDGVGELPLQGQRADKLRVCDGAGAEHLYEVTSRQQTPAFLRKGDEIRFAVDLPANTQKTYYIYAGNPVALSDDSSSLHASLRNGGFEEGQTAPTHWTPGLTSSTHLALYRSREGREQSACVYHHVRPGAPPAWVQWSQANIVVTPGRVYVVRGWVRARNAEGQVGYYVHVNGVRPQMVNIVRSAGEGTYDWRPVEIRFEVPPGGQTATIGTVLYGTGEAWYDDVTLVAEAGGVDVRWRALPAQRKALKTATARRDAWGKEWLVRATVSARNFEPEAVERMVAVSLPRAVHLVRRLAGQVQTPVRARVVDPLTGRAIPAVWIGDLLCFATRLQPLTEHHFHVYLSREQASTEELLRGYQQILRQPMNLAREGDFESRERALQLWASGGESTRREGFIAEVASPGRFGGNCLRLHIPQTRQLDWLGWRLLNVPVKPSSRYLYAAWVKTQDITNGTVDIHGHFKASDNSFAKGAQFFGSARRLSGNNDWTLCWSQVTTPADAHHVELHLTMLAHGTVWHDGVLFVPVQQEPVIRVDTNPALLPDETIAVWQVNPLVKVFPDDPPRRTSQVLTLESARNEWEPLHIAFWSKRGLKGVNVQVSALRHASGASLPAPRLYRVLTVPVDIPTNYYSSRLAQHYRHVPRGAPSCDGWAGEWPDPMLSLRPFDLPAWRTQSIWIDCYVPDNVPVGEYRGAVSVLVGGKLLRQIPLRVTVWNFTLPKVSNLRVIYDLRSGPGWDVTSGENPTVLRRWYQLMAEHRVVPDVVLPMPEFRVEGGRVVMDTSRFEPMARYAFDELGFKHCYTPWAFYALGWAYSLGEKFGFQPRTPDYEKALREAYSQLMEYFTRNGWRDRLIYYLSDEPHLNNPKVVDDLRYFIGVIKPVAPDVPIFSSTWVHSPDLQGYLSMWGIGQFGAVSVQKMRELRTVGDRLLFTTDGQQALDTPYLATERLLPLYCFVYDVEGYEFWGFSWWTHDPWQRGWHKYIQQSDQGQDFYWIRYPNGDGYLAYPARDASGFAPSIRLKAVREGAEDYEYYLLWQKAVERARQSGKNVSDAASLRQRMEALVPIPNAGGLRSTQILPNPDALYQMRREIAKQIRQWAKD